MERGSVCRHCGRIINSACCFGSLLFINRGRSWAMCANQQSLSQMLRDTDDDGRLWCLRRSSSHPQGTFEGWFLLGTLDFIVRGHITMHKNSYSKSQDETFGVKTQSCAVLTKINLSAQAETPLLRDTRDEYFPEQAHANRSNIRKTEHRIPRWPHSSAVNPIKIMRPPVERWSGEAEAERHQPLTPQSSIQVCPVEAISLQLGEVNLIDWMNVWCCGFSKRAFLDSVPSKASLESDSLSRILNIFAHILHYLKRENKLTAIRCFQNKLRRSTTSLEIFWTAIHWYDLQKDKLAAINLCHVRL